MWCVVVAGLVSGGELSVCCVAMGRPLPLSPVSPLGSGTRWSTVELRTRAANDPSVFTITEKTPTRRKPTVSRREML